MSITFDYKIEFDSTGFEKDLLKNLDEDSPIQQRWNQIIFDGSIGYMPMITGNLRDVSRIANGDFKGGEIIYRAPQARFLWYGKVMIDPDTESTFAPLGGTKIVTNRDLKYTTTYNAKAGPRWVERAANDNLSSWTAELQRFIRGN